MTDNLEFDLSKSKKKWLKIYSIFDGDEILVSREYIMHKPEFVL